MSERKTKGWRLPEPRDVVRVKPGMEWAVNPRHAGIDLTIVDTFLVAGKFTVRGGDLDMQYPFPDTFEPVRLHDESEPPQERKGWSIPPKNTLCEVNHPGYTESHGKCGYVDRVIVVLQSTESGEDCREMWVSPEHLIDLTADRPVVTPEPPQPIGTLDACRDRVELLNQGLDFVIAVLNNDAPPPALRDAAVLAVQAAKLKLGGES